MLDLITKLFYVSASIPLTLEMIGITHPSKILEIENIYKLPKEKIVTTGNQKLFIIGHLYYMIWTFIGLFSSQSLYFLMLFAISVITWTIKKYFKTGEKLEIIDSLICMIIILSIILTKY